MSRFRGHSAPAKAQPAQPAAEGYLCNAITNLESGQQCDAKADYEIEYGAAGTVTLHRCRPHAKELRVSLIRRATPLGTETPPLLRSMDVPDPD